MPKILIVDDNVYNIDMLKGSLEQQHEIYAATNGSIALRVVEKIHPDLILLDIVMPVMDGYEFYKRLVEKKIFDHVPIIFLSAMEEMDEQIDKLNSERFISFISKPFDMSEVIKTIDIALESNLNMKGSE